MKKLCVKCGKRIAIFRGFCEKCYLESHPLMLGFRDINLKVCSNCNTAFVRNKWINYDNINDLVKNLIVEKIKVSPEVLKIDVEADIHLRKNPGIFVNSEAAVSLFSRLGKNKTVTEEEYVLPVRIEVNYCNRCSLKGTQYFEGILQLRNPSDDVMNFVRKKTGNVAEKGIFIMQEKKVRGGVDIYVSSKKFVQELGREVVREFGGELKINPQLFSRNKQTSRDIYRVNVLVKLPDFKKGDFVEIEGNVCRIIGVGKKITVFELEAGRRSEIDLSRIKIKAVILEIKHTIVSKAKPEIEVIHPENYQSSLLSNKIISGRIKELKAGDLIDVVVLTDRVFAAE